MKILSVTSVPDEMNVTAGSQLIIPCLFHMDQPFYGHEIKMEWGLISKTEDSYKPLVHRYSPNALEMMNHRASIFNKLIEHGNCSLAINPINVQDAGTYTLHISVDDEEYAPSPMVDINVLEEIGKI